MSLADYKRRFELRAKSGHRGWFSSFLDNMQKDPSYSSVLTQCEEMVVLPYLRNVIGGLNDVSSFMNFIYMVDSSDIAVRLMNSASLWTYLMLKGHDFVPLMDFYDKFYIIRPARTSDEWTSAILNCTPDIVSDIYTMLLGRPYFPITPTQMLNELRNVKIEDVMDMLVFLAPPRRNTPSDPAEKSPSQHYQLKANSDF